MKKFLSLITLFLIFCSLSCSSEKPGSIDGRKALETENPNASGPAQSSGTDSKESYSLKIAPEDVNRNSTLSLTSHGFNQGDARIEWLVNERQTNSPVPNQFKTAETRKGDKIQAKATIQDREILSNMVRIKNTPPEIINARIVPEGKPGGSLSVEVSARDVDGDSVTFQYEWSKNGEPAGKTQRIEGPFKRGDKVSVRITPFDGEDYGRQIMLQREIANMPPVITDDKKVAFDGKVYTYVIKASDPDGDSLTYLLKSGPAGMTIDPSTGLLKWNVPQDFVGEVPVTVIVSDGHGGDVEYTFKAVINLEK